MDARRWERLRALFDELVDLPSAERALRLDALGEKDRDLRTALDSLLSADELAWDRLERVESSLIRQGIRPHTHAYELCVPDLFGLTGRTVAHFKVLEPIGAGGMGIVYRAEDTQLGRALALKFLLPQQALEDSAKRRFLREARAAAALDHRNICTIYEVGESTDGWSFIAMALYAGETLKHCLRREGHLKIEKVVDIARQIADGLACAHTAGVVHRDLKPGNLMLLPDGTVKILDFGLAKSREQSITGPRERFGTLAYMAPEQVAADGIVDHRVDLYAFGCVQYELLTGQPPFDVAAARTHARHVDEAARFVSDLRPETPSWLAQLVMRCLAKDPNARPQTANEIVRVIEAATSGEKPGTDAAHGAKPERSTRQSTADALTIFAHRTKWRAPAGLTSVVGALVILAGAGVLFGSRSHGATATPTLDPNTVAVLYFDSGDDSLRYLADAFTEGIIDHLGHVDSIRVVSPFGVRPFRGNAGVNVDSIAHVLEAGTIVTGSVAASQATGFEWRYEVVDGATGTPVTSSVARSHQGLLLQHELATSLLGSLERRLGRDLHIADARRDGPHSSAGWDAVGRARYMLAEAESVARTASYVRPQSLQLVASADSQLALAQRVDSGWVGPIVARGWLRHRLLGILAGRDSARIPELIEQAEGFADDALKLSPSNPEALELRGTAQYLRWLHRLAPREGSAHQLLLTRAEDDLRTSVEANRKRATAWSSLSLVLQVAGKRHMAGMAAREAYAIDPYADGVDSLVWRVFFDALAGRDAVEARRWCDLAARRFPLSARSPECQLWLEAFVTKRPNPARLWSIHQSLAAASREDGIGLRHENDYFVIALGLVRAGLRDSATRLVLSRRPPPDFVDSIDNRVYFKKFYADSSDDRLYVEMILRTWLHQKDEAFRLLGKFVERNPAWFSEEREWWFHDLWTDPRWQQIVARSAVP